MSITALLTHHLRDPLYKNSFFIMFTSIASSGFGFVFWLMRFIYQERGAFIYLL